MQHTHSGRGIAVNRRAPRACHTGLSSGGSTAGGSYGGRWSPAAVRPLRAPADVSGLSLCGGTLRRTLVASGSSAAAGTSRRGGGPLVTLGKHGTTGHNGSTVHPHVAYPKHGTPTHYSYRAHRRVWPADQPEASGTMGPASQWDARGRRRGWPAAPCMSAPSPGYPAGRCISHGSHHRAHRRRV